MSFTYIGKKPCGCIVCLCVDNPEHARDVAKSIADWIRKGLTVERMPTEDVRKLATIGCRCEKRQKELIGK